MRPTDRAEAIIAMYKQGKTLQEIGTHFMVSRERIRQILAKNGIKGNDGGRCIRSAETKSKRIADKEKRCLEKLGCTHAQYKEILKHCREGGYSTYSAPLRAFQTQKNNARLRGIEFNLKFWDWWQIWQKSGKWEQRGRGEGYVMARLMDSGPYEIGNIYITTSCKNTKHYQERRQKKSFDDWSDCYFPTLEAA
jgi:hypothetical protein